VTIKNNIDGAIAWLERYVAANHETEVAWYRERDQQKYRPLIENLRRFLAGGVSTDFGVLLPERDADARDRSDATSAQIVPRSIFKVKQWDHPREGRLYQAYLGSPTLAKRKGYLESLIVMVIDGEFKIVGRYLVCRTCRATGRVGEQRCPECSAPGWDYLEGLNLESFGTAQATRHLETPTNSAYLPEYESDLDLDNEPGA
jgi:hypothetical protein